MKALFDFIDRTRRSTCPTCRYSGPGMKTVLPNSAWAKVDFRLVPDQDPHQVFAQLQGFLDTIGCGDFQVTLLRRNIPARRTPASVIRLPTSMPRTRASLSTITSGRSKA